MLKGGGIVESVLMVPGIIFVGEVKERQMFMPIGIQKRIGDGSVYLHIFRPFIGRGESSVQKEWDTRFLNFALIKESEKIELDTRRGSRRDIPSFEKKTEITTKRKVGGRLRVHQGNGRQYQVHDKQQPEGRRTLSSTTRTLLPTLTTPAPQPLMHRRRCSRSWITSATTSWTWPNGR